MWRCRDILLVTFLAYFICVVISDADFRSGVIDRQDRDYDRQKWLAITPNPDADFNISENNKSEFTASQIDTVNHDHVPRRRRPLRKRKRGPNYSVSPARFRDNLQDQRPHRLIDQEHLLAEHWQGEALAEEATSYRRPGQKRRRIGPKYNEDDSLQSSIERYESEKPNRERTVQYQNKNDHQITSTEVEATYQINYGDTEHRFSPAPSSETDVHSKTNNKSYRKPYGSHRNQNDNAASENSPDLKTLLKQTNGALSLSEILQQRNLSLSDLLTGKQQAILALTDAPIISTDPSIKKIKHVNRIPAKYAQENLSSKMITDNFDSSDEPVLKRRLPPVNIYRDDRIDQKDDPSTMREYINDQRKRLSNLHNMKENKAFTDLIHYEVVTEATTEKRIFVPKNVKKSHVHINNQENMSNKKQNKDSENVFQIIVDSTENYDENYSTDKIVSNIPTYDVTIISTTKPMEEVKTETTKIKENILTTEKYYQSDMIIKGNGHVMTRNRLALKPKLRLPNINYERTLPKTNHEMKQKNQITQETTTQKYEKKRNDKNETEIITMEPIIPKDAFVINIKEIFGLSDIFNKTKENDGPLKISMNLEEMFEDESTIIKEIDEITTTEHIDTIKENTVIPVIATTNGPKIPTAEEEIMEVMKDTQGRERLGKVLASKNLTLEELVALRERGSSQLHLADIFHNQTKEPSPEDQGDIVIKDNKIPNKISDSVIYDEIDEQSSLESIIPKEIKKDSDGSSYFTSVVKILPPKSDDMYRQQRKHNIFGPNVDMQYNTEIQNTKVKSDSTEMPKTVYPAWKSYVYPNIYTPFDNSYLSRSVELVSTKYDKTDELTEDLQRIEQLENTIADTINDDLKINIKPHRILQDDDDDSYLQLPSGVKSAIIASSAIIGSSIVIFMTIFVACKWRQKQTRRLRYVNSFSGRIRSPILESQRKEKPKRNLNPVMITSTDIKNTFMSTETDNQKQQQYLWESIRKPFY